MIIKHSDFFKTSDNEKIFYSLNFEPSSIPDAPTIIFNYGLVCSNHHWSLQVEHFHKLGFNIITHDYRGHYESSGIDNIKDITFQRISEDICTVKQAVWRRCNGKGHTHNYHGSYT